MKKHIIPMLFFMLWASGAPAQQAAEGAGQEGGVVISNGFVMPSYQWLTHSGGTHAGEYEYLHESFGGAARFEYDPLPQRFEIEGNYLNQKDYFGEMDYAYRDVVLMNVMTRGIYHNLDHLIIGPDDPSTPLPSFVDRDPGDTYAVENTVRRAFIRFKTPNFPLHFYANVAMVDRQGTIQQIFMRTYSGGLNTVSESRNIDWDTREVIMGMNSHLGPIEVDYSHAEKKFEARGEKILFETYPGMTVPHNIVPDLKSSSDTIKLHTAYTGRVVGAVTYSSGDKKNVDSSAKLDFQNTAGDLTLVPVAGLVVVLKYRHYDLNVDNPSTVTVSSVGTTYNVRPSLSSKQDMATGLVSYRLNDRMGVSGYYTVQSIERATGPGGFLTPLQTAPVPAGSAPDFWTVAHRTTKTTEGLGFSYRIMKKLSLRADYVATQVANPAYANDPDQVNSAKVVITWTPVQRLFGMVSYSGTREKRSDLTAPLGGGGRKTANDQALGSITVLVGDRSSITASYLYYHSETDETLTFTDTAGMFILEGGVPYGDTAQVASLSASHALSESINMTADASRCYTEGRFRVNGTVPGSTGIDVLSDMKVVEDILTAGMEWRWSRRVGGDFRYQYRHYDDKVDNTKDGRVNTALATLHVKW